MSRNTARNLFTRSLAACALAGLSPLVASGIPIAPPTSTTIATVPVGDVGNPNDPLSRDAYGSVGYAYSMGTTEVTNAQYAAFLNAKAQSDPLGLYNDLMGSLARGGITRSGVSGSYLYLAKANMDNKPVNFVGWYDALRFTNWLNNGQGAGDTETGAYTLLGGTPVPTSPTLITRNVGASWVLPSENEWYKAAYYQPAAQGGDTDGYWLHATRSNSAPTIATANSVGTISNPGANVANYNSGADWNAQDGNLTTVGSAGVSSNSYYGTADQGGNVQEWIEPLVGLSRGLRGGSFSQSEIDMRSTIQNGSNPANESHNIGFRVANLTPVPEPSTGLLAILAGGLMWVVRRRIK